MNINKRCWVLFLFCLQERKWSSEYIVFFFFSYGSSLLGLILKLSEHPFKPTALLKPQGHDMPAVKLDHLG